MGKTTRARLEKQCDSCGQTEPMLFRIKNKVSDPWHFACKVCQSQAKTSQSGYEYGGTWKQSKRN